MARSQMTDQGRVLVRALSGEIREVALGVADRQKRDVLDAVDIVETADRFMIGISAIGGPDGIG